MLQSEPAVKIPEELVPSTEEAVRMYEEKGGRPTHNANSGIHPLALRPDLVESQEKLFSANQPTGPIHFLALYTWTQNCLNMHFAF